MTKAEEIEHAVAMIRAHIDGLELTTTKYIDRLEAIANSGGFITDETTENYKLVRSVVDLHSVSKRLNALHRNMLQNYLSFSLFCERERKIESENHGEG